MSDRSPFITPSALTFVFKTFTHVEPTKCRQKIENPYFCRRQRGSICCLLTFLALFHDRQAHTRNPSFPPSLLPSLPSPSLLRCVYFEIPHLSPSFGKFFSSTFVCPLCNSVQSVISPGLSWQKKKNVETLLTRY